MKRIIFAVAVRVAWGRTHYAVIDTRNGRTVTRSDAMRDAMRVAALMNLEIITLDTGEAGHRLLVTENDMLATLYGGNWEKVSA